MMINLGRWRQFTFFEKLGHLGSELSRAAFWHQRNHRANEIASLERCLEMTQLLIAETQGTGSKKELCRLKMIIQNNLIEGTEIHNDYAGLQNMLTAFAALKQSSAHLHD